MKERIGVFVRALRSVWFPLVAISLLCSCGAPAEETAQKMPDRPNIVFILADDLGYGEVGAYGQQLIETPRIDSLAESGMRFTQHYAGAPVCAPSRCVFLTGLHTGHAFIRSNHEWGERGDVWNFEKAVEDPGLEGQYPIPDETVTVAELLKGAGYRTAIVGKWGLGAPASEGVPNRQGFDFFFGYNCQRQAHTYYPRHLWRNDQKVWLDNPLVVPHTGLEPGADPLDPSSYARFRLNEYSPDLMMKETLEFLDRSQGEPFFLYFAPTIPHLPLQAPKQWVDQYVAKFGDEEPYTGDRYFPVRYPHATYAAMVSYLDDQVGQIVDKLKEMGVYDNTLIVFTSDNGPVQLAGTDVSFFKSAGPFRAGEGWGKGNVREAGIRVPMIASWPGRIPEGSESDYISAFYDFLPTFCQLAKVDAPADSDGLSLLPVFEGAENVTPHEFLYWEFPSYGGQQAVRMGPWKGVRRDLLEGKVETELYNLDSDPTEERNVAGEFPEIVAQIEAIMEKEHTVPQVDRFRIEALGDGSNPAGTE